jgi:hypothetical protein
VFEGKVKNEKVLLGNLEDGCGKWKKTHRKALPILLQLLLLLILPIATILKRKLTQNVCGKIFRLFASDDDEVLLLR